MKKGDSRQSKGNQEKKNTTGQGPRKKERPQKPERREKRDTTKKTEEQNPGIVTRILLKKNNT